MSSPEDRLTWQGMKVIDPDGESIGDIEEVYLDDRDEPAWAAVNTGLLENKLSFVPLEGADLRDRGYVTVRYDKRTVTHGPRLDSARALDAEEEADLRRYYALDLPRDEDERTSGRGGRGAGHTGGLLPTLGRAAREVGEAAREEWRHRREVREDRPSEHGRPQAPGHQRSEGRSGERNEGPERGAEREPSEAPERERLYEHESGAPPTREPEREYQGGSNAVPTREPEQEYGRESGDAPTRDRPADVTQDASGRLEPGNGRRHEEHERARSERRDRDHEPERRESEGSEHHRRDHRNRVAPYEGDAASGVRGGTTESSGRPYVDERRQREPPGSTDSERATVYEDEAIGTDREPVSAQGESASAGTRQRVRRVVTTEYLSETGEVERRETHTEEDRPDPRER